MCVRRMSLMELRSTQSCAGEAAMEGGAAPSVSTQPFNMFHTHTCGHTHTYIVCVTKKVDVVFIQQLQASCQQHYGDAIVLFTFI